MSEALFSAVSMAAIISFLVAAALAPSPKINRASLIVEIAGILALLMALIGLGGVFLTGAPIAGADGGKGLAAFLRIDALSAIMFTLVSFVGLVVLRYSRNYLAGDPRQPIFLSRLCLTLASVTLLVTAGDVFVLFGAWVATSLTLHQLLVYRHERSAAIIAARKKFIVARVGDAALGVAAVLLATTFGSSNISEILTAAEAARAADDATVGAGVAAMLIAAAAALKSAQFPTHGWLTEVMETPTPVSALLHAGVVNAGGFLVIRFADVMLISTPAMHALALIGGFTALFGSIVMLTQTSVKASLAYSTIAQMGFMLLQCGLGAFASATLHLVAHSLYKAHAFLSSGRIVNAIKSKQKAPAPNSVLVFASFIGALGIYYAIAAMFGGVAKSPAILTLGALFIMGTFIFLTDAARKAAVFVRALAITVLASVSYFALQTATAAIMKGAVPPPPAPDVTGLSVMGITLISFGAVTLVQILSPARAGRMAQTAYVHAANGLYANALFDRLVGALRLRRNAISSGDVTS
ncbi:MAG: proton-conducting transporter membrane subunit [Pseudomonadota bacterium]